MQHQPQPFLADGPHQTADSLLQMHAGTRTNSELCFLTGSARCGGAIANPG